MSVKWKIAGVLATVLLTLQLVRYGAYQNPPTAPEYRFDKHLQVPANVNGLINRACLDCHSNETRWPWYSRVARLSWLIGRDVEKGRKALNLSEWSLKSGRRPAIAASALLSACSTAQAGKMPRFPYQILHPDAKLDAEDKKLLCQWTTTEARRLLRSRSVPTAQKLPNELNPSVVDSRNNSGKEAAHRAARATTLGVSSFGRNMGSAALRPL